MTVYEIKKQWKVEELFIAEEEDGCAWLWGLGKYESHSVLAGQTRQVRIEPFDSVKEAQEAFPTVSIRRWNPSYDQMSDVAPDWFDPSYAGETW